MHTSIAQHKNASPETLNYLIDTYGHSRPLTGSLGGLHHAVVENPNADADVLHKIAVQRGRVNASIAGAVAKHPNTGMHTLHHLLKNESGRKRGPRHSLLKTIIKHPNAPAAWAQQLGPALQAADSPGAV